MKFLFSLFLLPLTALAAPNPATGTAVGEHGSVTRVATSEVFTFPSSSIHEYTGDKTRAPNGVSSNPQRRNLFKREWGDCKGSTLCWKLHADLCQEAYSRFDPNQYYTSYTARVGYDESKNLGFGQGCIAKYECSNGYPEGVTGGNIWWEFNNRVYFGGANCEKCGTWHWDNGCTFSLDYCFNCIER